MDYHAHLKALQEQAADDLGIELVPGTFVCGQTAHAHFVTRGKEVLIPQPDPDRNDPLTWSSIWKIAIVVNQFIFVVTTNLPALGIAPMSPLFEAAFNVSFARVSLYTGVTVLCLGWANFILVPVANIYGRRFAILVGGSITAASMIWSAVAKSDKSFIASRALTGLGAAANESVMGMIISDTFFLHERGAFLTIYFCAYFCGTTLGPTISGAIAASYGQAMFFWICLALVSFSVVLSAVALPETRWSRLTLPKPTSPASTPNNAESKASSSHNPELDAEGKPFDSRLEHAVNLSTTGAEPEKALATVQDLLGKGRPGKKQFALIQSADRNALDHVVLDFFTPIRLFCNPIVCWASFNIGFAANSLLAFNILESAVLSGPPYNFAPGKVGATNTAFFVGGLVGMAVAGPLGDAVSGYMTRRNRNIREPEFRLLALLPFSVLTVVGMSIIALSFERQWQWEVIVLFGFFVVGVQIVSIPGISLAYAVDCYKPVSGEILTIATVCKNTFGFGQTYWMPEMMISRGFGAPIWVMTGLCAFFMLLTIPMYFYGKAIRRWTRHSPYHSMNQG